MLPVNTPPLLYCTLFCVPEAAPVPPPPPEITAVARPVFAVAVSVAPFAPINLDTSVYKLTLPEVE